MSKVIAFPDILMADDAATGRGVALDMCVEISEGRDAKAVARKYGEDLARSVQDEPFQSNIQFLAGFIDGLIEYAELLKR